MIFRLHEIKLKLEYTKEDILNSIISNTGLQKKNILSNKIIRRSLDARRDPVYNLVIEFKCNDDVIPKKSNYLKKYKPDTPKTSPFIKNYTGLSPIIVGAGPTGLMAALKLAEHGIAPTIYERGSDAYTRAREIEEYIKTGKLNTESNILFGEGGAGLFSDGKLTTRSKNKSTMKYFFEKLVECGAPRSILIDSEPHLGSDVLLQIVPRLREMIIQKGGKFHFNSTVTDLVIKDNKVSGIIVNGKKINTNHCILATGHSARDVYKFLSKKKIDLEPKGFAIGVRVEISQTKVNLAQYGKHVKNPLLKPAFFRLVRKAKDDFRACYTFCMCPGGTVLSCASSEGMITTNGMSLSKRNGSLANAGFLVPVNVEDYQDFHQDEYPNLAGMFFQESIEKKIFEAGGSDYSIPTARLTDYIKGIKTDKLPHNISCKRAVPTKINDILPDFINKTLINSIPKMMSILGEYNYNNVTVFAAETRSSSPVRILRNKEENESTNTKGLFPCGEGAGYAGGIVSSAIDGIKIAESILDKTSKV